MSAIFEWIPLEKMVSWDFYAIFFILWNCVDSYDKHFFHSVELYDKHFLSTWEVSIF